MPQRCSLSLQPLLQPIKALRLRFSSAATIQSLAIISQATHATAPAEQAAGYANGLQWISAWPMHLQIHHSPVQASC